MKTSETTETVKPSFWARLFGKKKDRSEIVTVTKEIEDPKKGKMLAIEDFLEEQNAIAKNKGFVKGKTYPSKDNLRQVNKVVINKFNQLIDARLAKLQEFKGEVQIRIDDLGEGSKTVSDLKILLTKYQKEIKDLSNDDSRIKLNKNIISVVEEGFYEGEELYHDELTEGI